MDRFLMHVRIDYPSDADEVKVLRLVREEQARPGTLPPRRRRSPQQAIFDAREPRSTASRPSRGRRDLYGRPDRGDAPSGRVRRQAQALDRHRRQPARLARARPHVAGATPGCRGATMSTPEDVQAVAHDCLRHRLSLSYEASADGMTADDVIDEIIRQVAVAA